jgi:hypothetical protein
MRTLFPEPEGHVAINGKHRQVGQQVEKSLQMTSGGLRLVNPSVQLADGDRRDVKRAAVLDEPTENIPVTFR